jgi:prepilin-type N-terminal cleavage/methylation domain-containing protein
MSRRGFSLLEVLLASSILLGCLIVLSELASIGRRHVCDAEDLITAERICQTKVNEIVAGLQEPVAVEYAEVEDEPGWFYSVETEPVRQHGLIAVRVTVTQDAADTPWPQEFALVRWVRDPDTPRGLGDLDFWESFFFTPALGGRR